MAVKMFQFKGSSVLLEEISSCFSQSKTIIPYGGHIGWQFRTKREIF